MSTAVELDDIQGLVRFGYKHLTEARFVLMRVRDRTAARAWLASAPVAGAADVKPLPRVALHVALSAAGMRALGVVGRIVDALSPEFVSGLASDESRSRRLGDTGTSAPSQWTWGTGEHEPHVVLLLYADAEGIGKHVAGTLAGCAEGFEAIATLDTATLDRYEPFGFADGISQPELDWDRMRAPRDETRYDYSNRVCLGDFLLGYPDEYGQYADRPFVDPREDPGALLLPAEDDSSQRDFARNGTYLVLRSLRQDVGGFWRFVDAKAGGDSAGRTRLAEAMVGRTLEGCPLVANGSQGIEGVNRRPSEEGRNDFTFRDDPDGVCCPVGAHIRRTNPRNGDLPPGGGGLVSRALRVLGFDGDALAHDHVASTRFHRILRRGRKYGSPITVDAALAGSDEGGDRGIHRGIHFMCLGASIARQFEFVQGAWITGAKFAALKDEGDPLLGRRAPEPDGTATDRFSMPSSIGPDRRIDGLPEFVTVEGGGYFFLPGIRALRYLATAPGDAPPIRSNISRRQPSARTGSAVLDLIADTSMKLIRLERRIDPFVRPALDALFKTPTERLVTALMNLQRKDEGLRIAEERPLPDEEAHLDSIVTSFRQQMSDLWKPGGFERGGNTKTQGIVRAEFIVHDGIPEPMRRGIYVTPRRYPAWVRFSGPGPYITPDIEDVGFMSISIKLMDVPGPKLMDDEQHTLDMFGVSTATFVTGDTRSNADLQKWSVKNAALFHFVNFTEPHLLDFIMQGLYTKTQTSVFEAPYFSCVPYLMGEGQAMVYSVWPKTNQRTPIPNLPRKPPDDYLRIAMVNALAKGDVDLDFRIQMQTDPFRMPIEDNGVLWPVSRSPRVSVATIHIPRQKFDTPAQMDFARKLSYNPWHTIAEHRPLGNQSRARKRMYWELSQFRHRMNAVPHAEPDGTERFD